MLNEDPPAPSSPVHNKNEKINETLLSLATC